MSNFRFHAERDICMDSIPLRMVRNEDNGDITIAESINLHTFRKEDRLGRKTDSVIDLQPVEAKNLMNALWDAGIRPNAIGSAGHLAATEKHLKDMSEIAKGLLRKDGVAIND